MPWERREFRIRSFIFEEARSSLVFGQEYRYKSADNNESKTYQWKECKTVKNIGRVITGELGFEINNCFLNYYKDGKENIGYHRDKNLVPPNFVCSVSFGGSRDFFLQKQTTDPSQKETIKVALNDGDLFVMHGETNNLYKHSIPKRAKADPRISLTFRKIKE